MGNVVVARIIKWAYSKQNRDNKQRAIKLRTFF